ncbi:LysR family transcriptional regulator [Labrenzia sp. PHM005]|uniref:LysR family transcriptional regulator n=1 Tax=Labrenzia sp. PHM005 TaxID=2590016 RepID=UPI00113FFBA3|nr:LysR family transcriptional regulator [Labrenzia sp. PHM005]QDG77347.1 LysR family transcriptional regulator [Labrenzia sp. PHM005]
MDLRWFEDVLVLLEEQNLTRAAARRNITQPAFSRRIRSFEDWLGTPLLERKANSVEIHPALLDNEEEIKSIVKRAGELRNRVRTYSPERVQVTITTQHSLLFSAFPDIAALTREKAPQVNFRLKAGNRTDCISMFLRGEASVLLCYEAENSAPLPFDITVQRNEWGKDRLIPVIGGRLRYTVLADGCLPEDTPAVAYPENSHFGELLNQNGSQFGTANSAQNPVYVTAFSAGIKELVSSGLGVSWLPMSMVHRELESGKMINLSSNYGSIPLSIIFYTTSKNNTSKHLQELWSLTDP